MKNQIPIYLLIVGVGIVIGILLQPTPDSGTTTDTSSNTITSSLASSSTVENDINVSTAGSPLTESLAQLKKQVNSLQTKLATEVEHRLTLENKLASLEDALDTAAPEQTVAENESSRIIRTRTRQNATMPRDNNWFNEQALVVAGIDPTKADYLKNLYEDAEMEKLYLRDQATREGWMGTERFQTAMNELNKRTESVRPELDDKEYDAYLYAAGKANRVIVSSILNNSPANQSGILPGDSILKYDNKRIYSWTDLTSATQQGTPDAMVSLTIERNGQQQQLYIPRGPLGVRLTTDSIAP